MTERREHPSSVEGPMEARVELPLALLSVCVPAGRLQGNLSKEQGRIQGTLPSPRTLEYFCRKAKLPNDKLDTSAV